jgi:hypothetical protein
MVRLDIVIAFLLGSPIQAAVYPLYFLCSMFTRIDNAPLHFEAAEVYADLALYLFAFWLGRRAYLGCRHLLCVAAK